MLRIAKIVTEVSLNQEFDYEIPEDLVSKLKIGSQVEIPFNNRNVKGFVVGFSDFSDYRENLKSILGVVGSKPLIPKSVIDLAYWISDYYCSSIESSIKTLLPSVIRRRNFNHKKQLGATLLTNSIIGISELQNKIVDYLKNNGPTLVSELQKEIGCSISPINTLAKKKIISLKELNIRRNPFLNSDLVPTTPLKLTDEQENALIKIKENLDKLDSSVTLLHGVTGSGKTEVYLQSIDYIIKKNQGAIVLVPEIALTPQTVNRFRARFGEIVAVLHSSLSEGERHDEWHRVFNGNAKIVVGARSALFAPIENLGLIILDEEHEPTYKQDESPRYNARDVAVIRGKIEKCAVLLGSATPSLESINNVRLGKYDLVKMLKRVDFKKMPVVRTIDMEREIEETGQPGLFSRELIDAIYERLNKKEQVILFLNRRGFSSSVMCNQCGYINECSSCSVTKHYHKVFNKFICHVCGEEEDFPKHCPSGKCEKPSFKFSGSGTEKIEEVLMKLCPSANIVRMDSDSMRKKDSYEKIFNNFRKGKIDILVGTQMIAKGLDFPNVTLVGVLNADLSLYIPDFRAGERTLQLLTQVSGRAGRGEMPGEVLIQTYTPNHPAIEATKKFNSEEFINQDMKFRKEMNYPPFSHIVLVTFAGPDENIVLNCINDFYNELNQIIPKSVKILKPVPSSMHKIRGMFRYQILLSCKFTAKITKPIKYVLENAKFPKNIKIVVDVDAVSLS